ncbi:hypothetical protein OIE63_08690 [Streptomyces sp. NBC_01795]|uniref:hypothetical protein n=1 Tax=unclassified Streptomyces TaxID=2593676 RepID=UPI002DD7D9B7|nr:MULTISPECIES: hypothetical protein [unclassified Streptomyces]WSA91630.1 hypothetical protein OIE63_08690 [Streptomyces sp. NBC_01795]WSB76001.1 hypothetical protein OHB04_09495 [Streptomyces sp. NBC_01775]
MRYKSCFGGSMGGAVVPRPGGETDKFGNRYEAAWTVRHALYVLLGRGESLTVEPDVPLGEGAEFVFYSSGRTEVHQVKRQDRNANNWSVASLRRKEIWQHLRTHAEAGRHFHFVSTVPARPLQELSDRARRSDDYPAFVAGWLTEELRSHFDELASPGIYGSPEMAWRMLRFLWVQCHDEGDVVAINTVLAEQTLEGFSGCQAALALGDLLNNNLGARLDAAAIMRRLAQYGLRRMPQVDAEPVVDAVGEATRRWAASTESDLLKPVIQREEASRLMAHAGNGQQITLLTGAAGDGKSAVLHQTFAALDEANIPVLAFRLDRLASFATTAELGELVGLPVSPVSALETVAQGRSCFMIVDQLDAVSRMSGRAPEALDAVADLIREATLHPAMRIILACRKFDVDNDPRIRQLTEEDRCIRVAVGSLTDTQIDAALTAMDLEATDVDPTQRVLLGSPLNLVLLASIARQDDALSFRTTKQLFDAFWDTKRINCRHRYPSVRFNDVVTAVAEAMSDRQQLEVPYAVLDGDDLSASANVLVSEHVCVRDGQHLAFFHESFFDYAFARGWASRGESLSTFLTRSEQELFRRGQVRQILTHLRELEPERFAEGITELLARPDIRYHIKHLVLAVLRDMEAPTAIEWDAVAQVLDGRPAFAGQLAHSLSTSAWFHRIYSEGAIEDWLSGNDPREHDWALRIMAGGVAEYPEEVAGLLGPHTSAAEYPSRLAWIIRFAEISESRALFDLLLDAVRTGRYGEHERFLWVSLGDLGSRRPEWAVELLSAHLVERPGALELDGTGKVRGLLSRDHSVLDLVKSASAGAPEAFCDWLLPTLLKVMETTALSPRLGWPVADRHFGFRYPDDGPSTLDEAFLQGISVALRTVAQQTPLRARPFMEQLADVPYDAAQWLLYQALGAAGEASAGWAAELLLQGRHRLLSPYGSNVSWGARQVIRSISGFLPAATHHQLEEAILYLRLPPKEKLSPWTEFNLLSAMSEHQLSTRAARRLGELIRLHGGQSQPAEPQKMTARVIGAPIETEPAQRMNDDQWLRAMKTHHEDKTDWERGTGGAREQAHVLENQTMADPARFARLALRFDAETHSAYGASLLLGLGKAESLSNPAPVFAAVRHLANLGKPEHDRWLGWSLRQYLASVPLDLVGQLLDRALHSADPAAGDSGIMQDGERDLLHTGMNTVRGSAAESLGDLLIHDPDGSRSALVIPQLDILATDPSPAVRARTAHTLHAALRHFRPEATEAFTKLIATDDQLLATRRVVNLVAAMSHEGAETTKPVIERMLTSPVDAVRMTGGAPRGTPRHAVGYAGPAGSDPQWGR